MTTLIATFKTPRDLGTCAGQYVLRYLPMNKNHPYIVHWQNTDLGGYSTGGYYTNVVDAARDFNERVATWCRNYGNRCYKSVS